MNKEPSNVLVKFHNIEILRFIFAVIIVYFHITNNSSIKNMFLIEGLKCWNSYIIVEFFFIIAGFFLFQTFKNTIQTWPQFVMKKVIRLWPVLAFHSIIMIILIKFLNINVQFGGKISEQFMDMFFLQSIGFTPDHGGCNWFVSVYFWVIILYFYILKNFDSKYANLIIALCVYFSFVGNLNHTTNFSLREITLYCYFFNSGVLRAIASIGLGYFIGILFDKIKNSNLIYFNLNSIKTFAIITALETLCFMFLINYLLLKSNLRNAPVLIITFSIMFLLLLLKKGAISKILDNKYLALLGKYSYSIYTMQGIAFIILEKTIWQNTYFLSNTSFCLTISLGLSIVLGILTYYLVEKPSAKYLKTKFHI